MPQRTPQQTAVEPPIPLPVGAQHPRPCDTCGNTYDKAFEVHAGDSTYTFDCFECAIQALAPSCAHCQCRVIGHGIESHGSFYCCAHCARQHGERGAVDRIED